MGIPLLHKLFSLSSRISKYGFKNYKTKIISNRTDLHVNKFNFVYLETVRACPVKCVPCPLGRDVIDQHPAMVIDLDVARKCFIKLQSEFQVSTLIMGNWGEPLLHPNFAELVKISRETGFQQIGVSTSLSVKTDISRIAFSGLDSIAISISGISKDVYNKSHRQGDFDLVMHNLEELVTLVKKFNLRTKITIRWHRYKHNEFQYEEFKKLCDKLYIGYNAYFGHLGSIEALRDWENNCLEEPLKNFTDNNIFTEFIMQACDLNKSAQSCRQSDFLVIDADATLLFCCSCYSHYKQSLDFLSLTPLAVHKFKQLNSSICLECLANGWAGYMNRPKTLEEYGGLINLTS